MPILVGLLLGVVMFAFVSWLLRFTVEFEDMTLEEDE